MGELQNKEKVIVRLRISNNLAAGRYKPQEENPADLIRKALAIEREITEGLEKQLKEIKEDNNDWKF
ncbi:hypothetical protein BMS3Bbin03_00045 [bacterium BMS3Bbin03]|nr:hypothetical protein BMS3Bbin03_00045 [bacterium BMS3Bbin03]